MTIPSAKPGHLGCDLTNAFSIVIDFNFDELLMLAVQPVSNTIQNFGPVGSTVSPIGLLRRRERSFNSEVNVSFVPLAICAQTAPVAGLMLSIHSPLFGGVECPFMKC